MYVTQHFNINVNWSDWLQEYHGTWPQTAPTVTTKCMATIPERVTKKKSENLIHTWNIVAAGSSWQTVTSITLIWPVYMKCNILAIAVGQTPCNFTRDISHSLRPPVNIAWNKSHTSLLKKNYISEIWNPHSYDCEEFCLLGYDIM